MGKMRARVSLQDVARQAGVHLSTVSLAIRNDPRLPVATRNRIQSIANKLGYKSNPLLQAWMQQVRQPDRAPAGVGMALVTANQPGAPLATVPFYRKFIEGVKEQAAELGFNVSEWDVSPNSSSPARVVRAIKYQGIRGILIFDPSEVIPEKTARLFAEDFAVVVILRCGGNVPFHRVATDPAGNMALAIDTVRKKGFQRIGCTLGGTGKSDFSRGIASQFLLAQHQWKSREIVPLLLCDPYPSKKDVLTWFRRHKPDAIISGVQNNYEALVESGVRIPEDTMFCLLGAEVNPLCPGVDSRATTVGSAAVFKLASLLHSNRTGLPEVPLTITVPGVWKEFPSGH